MNFHNYFLDNLIKHNDRLVFLNKELSNRSDLKDRVMIRELIDSEKDQIIYYSGDFLLSIKEEDKNE